MALTVILQISSHTNEFKLVVDWSRLFITEFSLES